MKMRDKKRLPIDLELDTHTAFKEKCVRERKSMGEMVTSWIKRWLKKD